VEHFINSGFGWICTHCRPENVARDTDDVSRARFLSEGEAEKDQPLSTLGLARWRDASRQVLYCPTCSIEERINTR
jgi:hypothetical protein